MMGAILSLVAILMLAATLFMVGSSTMATYSITFESCMASLLPICLVSGLLVGLLLALLLLRTSMWDMVLWDRALFMVVANLSTLLFSMGAALSLMGLCMMEPTALTTDMSMMLATLVAFPRYSATQLVMESTMATTYSATTFSMMGAILSLVVILILVATLSMVGSSTMATYLITSEWCMASLLPTCLVSALLGVVLMLRLVVMLSWATNLVWLLRPIRTTRHLASTQPINP